MKGSIVLIDDKIMFKPDGRIEKVALSRILKKYGCSLCVLLDMDDPAIEDDFYLEVEELIKLTGE